MPYGMSIETSLNWPIVIHALREDVLPITEEEMLLLAKGAALEGKTVAQGFLDELVYDAPLPQSAFFEGWTDNGHPGKWVYIPGDPSYYLERSRTGRTRRAVKDEVVTIGPETVARTFVDKGDYPAFFYALALEYGMAGTFPTYYPRPFWSATSALMKITYRELGNKAARQIVTRINGRFAR